MRRAVLFLVLAGCYSPSYEDCAVRCGDHGCPSGLTCDSLGYCRAPGASGACSTPLDGAIDGPSNDRDRDGLLDTADNCPDVANVDQADEDMDGTGDACDLCPIAGGASADQDGDGDGVGNACDPSPDAPGDKIERFEGFNGASGSANILGTWTFAGGSASHVYTQDEPPARVCWLAPSSSDVAGARASTILTYLTIDALQGAASGVGVTDQYKVSGSTGVGCDLLRSGSTNGSLLGIVTTFDDAIQASATDNVDPGVSSGVSLTRIDTSYSCRSSTNPNGVAATVSSVSGGPTPLICISAKQISARFNWVLVVSSPNTP